MRRCFKIYKTERNFKKYILDNVEVVIEVRILPRKEKKNAKRRA